MKSKWITHNDKEIIFCDYSRLDFDGLEKEVDEVDSQVELRPPKSVLGLVYIDGVIPSPHSLDILKRSTLRVKDYTRKTAVVGLGHHSAMIAMFNIVVQLGGLNAKAFDKLEEAKDWLVSD